MTYAPHLRLTMTGHGPGTDAEIFSMSLSLVPDGSAWTTLLGTLSPLLALREYLESSDDVLFQDIVDDCAGFFNAAKTHGSSVITRVKLAGIGPDGHYVGPPREAVVSQGGGSNTGVAMPWQISQKVTLETDGDLGRVKGGFYIPFPMMNYDYGTDLWSQTDVQAQQNAVVNFINNLSNAPGFDTHSFKVVVASQGRHNPDGSVRVAPANHEVKRVHMGRRPDVIRRRANAVPEQRLTAANVEQ